MSNSDDTDLLIKLLDGELPETEREELLRRMETDEALKTEWSVVSQTRDLMQQFGQKKKIGVLHREMMTELSNPAADDNPVTPPDVHRIFRVGTAGINRLRAVAAILILLLTALLYPYFSATPAKLFAGQFEVYHPGEWRDGRISPIAGDYQRGDRGQTIADYRAGRSTGPKDDFLVGNAYLQLHQPLPATVAFQAVKDANHRAGTHFLEAETEYYLGLSWLAASEPKKALPFFEQIRADRHHPYHDQLSWWFMLKLRRLASR